MTQEQMLLGPICYRCGAQRIAGVCSQLGCFEVPEVYAALAARERIEDQERPGIGRGEG